MIPFLILFEGRSGSSYLTSLLNSHPGALCYPEITPPLDDSLQLRMLEGIAAGEDLRPLNRYAGHPRYQVTDFAAKWRTRPFAAMGTKTKQVDVKNQTAFFTHAALLKFQLVHLTRRNPVKGVVSMLNARRLVAEHRLWNAESPTHPVGPLLVDLAAFDAFLERRRTFEAATRAAFADYTGAKMMLHYQDVLQGDIAGLLAFLGLAPATLSSKLFKNTDDDLRSAVANYDALAAHCVASGLADHLPQ